MGINQFFRKLVLLVMFPAVVFAAPTVSAEPAPEKLVVNHEAKECAAIFGGDECMDCFPPEGWEVIGWADREICPEGYTFTEVEEECFLFKNEFCCSEGHSGAHGDCEDMVLNDTEELCAFVPEIYNCYLPVGWRARPENITGYDWACPGSYEWTDDLDCLDEPAGFAFPGGATLRCGGMAFGALMMPLLLAAGQRRQNL